MRLPWLSAALLVLGLTVQPTAASATLLYAGGEDTDFICNGGTCAVRTSAGLFRTGWARSAYTVLGQNADPPTNRFATPAFAASSTVWIHAQYCTYYSTLDSCNDASTTNSMQMLRVVDSAGNATLVVRGTGTLGQVKISSRTAAGAFTDLVTCSSAVTASLTQLDLYVNYGTSGEVALYSNGAQVCNFVGNVTNGDGATTLNRVEFAAPYVATSRFGAWSEVIIATTDTRAMWRFTANTVGNGSATGFSGTNVCSAIWGATAYNDGSYAYSGSNDVVHECTIRNSIPGGVFNVVALVMSARTLVGTTGPQHFDFVTRTNGTDYLSNDFAPLPTFSNITNYIQTVNPATSAPWSLSDFTAAGFNVGQKTKP